MAHITKLIRYTLSISDYPVYISMRMAINPTVYVTISDEVSKFRSEGPIYRTAHEIR